MSLYAKIADLPLEITSHSFDSLSQVVPSGWARKTTLIRLAGGGVEGHGEDVIWNDEDHRVLEEECDLQLAGHFTVDEFSRYLDTVELFARPASRDDCGLYRRWAFESAALDLALRQAGISLAEALGIEPQPMTFVISTGLGDPASIEPLRLRLDLYPGMRFKLDLSASWTPELVAALADLDVVDTVDLKGLYHGDFSGAPPNPEQYRYVAEGLAAAWIEDPAISSETLAVLGPFMDRVTWDANIHSMADIITLPAKPRCINIKPSRFGFISELFRTYEYCRGQGIAMYGGGQLEVGVGRGQAQYLAALFHHDTANDIAPLPYNEQQLAAGLPESPLPPPPAEPGFRWVS